MGLKDPPGRLAERTANNHKKKSFSPKSMRLHNVGQILLICCAVIPLTKNIVNIIQNQTIFNYIPNRNLPQYVPNKNAATSTSRSTTTTTTTTVNPIPNQKTPINIREVAQLKLQPWENINQCNPPKNVRRGCCLGSVSRGGMVGYWPSLKCVSNKTQDVYDQAEAVAAEYLAEIPQASTSQCDVCQIMEYLFDHNASLAFVGDSVLSQTANSFECELYKRGYNITQRLLGVAPRKMNSKYGIKEMVNLTVWDPMKDQSNKTHGLATINFYKAYRPLGDEIRILAEQHDIVIFDHGLHYLPREEAVMKKEMAEALNFYTNVTGRNQRLKLLAWRETLAQNFDSPTGDFISTASTPFHFCVPLKNRSKYSIRTDWMKDATKIAGMNFRTVLDPHFQDRQWKLSLRDLVFLPFYEFSSKLLFMKGGECTHPCHTPGIWLPTFRMLRLAMDKLYAA